MDPANRTAGRIGIDGKRSVRGVQHKPPSNVAKAPSKHGMYIVWLRPWPRSRVESTGVMRNRERQGMMRTMLRPAEIKTVPLTCELSCGNASTCCLGTLLGAAVHGGKQSTDATSQGLIRTGGGGCVLASAASQHTLLGLLRGVWYWYDTTLPGRCSTATTPGCPLLQRCAA